MRKKEKKLDPTEDIAIRCRAVLLKSSMGRSVLRAILLGPCCMCPEEDNMPENEKLIRQKVGWEILQTLGYRISSKRTWSKIVVDGMINGLSGHTKENEDDRTSDNH